MHRIQGSKIFRSNSLEDLERDFNQWANRNTAFTIVSGDLGFDDYGLPRSVVAYYENTTPQSGEKGIQGVKLFHSRDEDKLTEVLNGWAAKEPNCFIVSCKYGFDSYGGPGSIAAFYKEEREG